MAGVAGEQEGQRAPPAEEGQGLQAACCTAVALGWQMAQLYAGSQLEVGADVAATGGPHATSDLPGTGKLDPRERLALRLGQVEHGLGLLAQATDDERLHGLLTSLRARIGDGQPLTLAGNARPPDGERLRALLRELHVELLSALTIADYRLGKSYGLGRALCELSRGSQADAELGRHLDAEHLAKLIGWCSDLKTALPDHAGQAVADSLRRWRSWARNRPWRTVERREFDQRLRRQGERWRSILTGERAARDLLTAATYVKAAEQLLADAARVGVGFSRKFWWILLVALLLLGGGVYLLAQGSGGGNLVGGIGSVAASLGLTWKTATPTLTAVGERLSGPLWGAELDAAITDAVTDPLVPAGGEALLEVVDVEPPPVGAASNPRLARMVGRRVWRRLDRSTRRRALAGEAPLKRLAYRLPPRRSRRYPQPFMPHDRYLSHVQSLLEQRVAGKRLETPALTEDELYSRFGPNDIGWVKTGVEATLTWLEGDTHAFGERPAERQLADDVTIVLFADWATGTARAQRLAATIRNRLSEAGGERHLIHLGDVYYCGLPAEYESRFLKYWPASGLDGVRSWNLNGNHDMYSGGQGYFSLISGDEGKLGVQAQMFAHQQGTSYFRLYNEHWQIVGLDTAYLDNDLTHQQLPALQGWVEGSPARKTILLSHHQLGSSRAQRSVGPGIRNKTAAVRASGRVHAWFWGHEHRCFVYDEYLGVKCPVCIGNGGVPELLSAGTLTLSGAFQAVTAWLGNLFARVRHPSIAPPKAVFEPRPDVDAEDHEWEPLGFAVITLRGSQGTAVYVDEHANEHQIASFSA